MTAQPAIIDGKRVLGESAAHVLDVIDPATGNLLDQTIRGGAPEVDAAVDAARRAADGWSHTPYAARSAVLRGQRGKCVTASPEQGNHLPAPVRTPEPFLAIRAAQSRKTHECEARAAASLRPLCCGHPQCVG